MVRRSVADDSYGRASFAWAIELGEVHTLPCAQFDRTIAYRERHAVADEDRLDVSGTVPFSVLVFRIARDHSLERSEEVFLHIGVRVLVHEDRRGRVRDRDSHDPVADLRARDSRLHAGGYVDRFLAPLCLDCDGLVPHAHARLATRASASGGARVGSATAGLRLIARRYFGPKDADLGRGTRRGGRSTPRGGDRDS